MKVIKPQALSLLTRSYEFRRRMFLGVSVLAMVPLSEKRTLVAESGMWPMVSEVLGGDGVVDEGIPKMRGEFLVAGSAWAPQGESRTMSRVHVRLGSIEKTLNVIGNRFFSGDRMSEPEPFHSIDLSWANAFGGEGFPMNPMGKGYRPERDEAGRKRYIMPNLEYPDDMMSLPGQKTRPAALGPVDPTWKQRRMKVGTYDDKWLRSDYPGFAADIDWSFFNLASKDQQMSGGFRGDEEYLLEGLHPERPVIRGRLPGFGARCFVRHRGNPALEELQGRLTTVWLFPDRLHAVMIFHASVEVQEPDASDLSEIMIAADNLDAPRSQQHYADVFARRMDEEKGAFEMLRDQDLVPEGIDRGDGPDGSMGGSESIRTGQLRRRMKAEMAEGEQRLAEEMGKIGVTVPPAEPEPDFGFDPDNLQSIRLEDLPEIMDRMEAYSLEKRPELEALQRDGRKRLDVAVAELKSEFPNAKLETPTDGTGPPKFRAEAREQEIRKMLDDMESEGFDVTEIRAGLLGPEMLELLRFAEASSIQAYRMSANYKDAAPSATNARELGAKLLEAVGNGEPMDARDYTGADLSGMKLAGADLSGVFLESANLSGSDLSGANLERAVLAHADLSGSRLDRARLKGANVGSAKLTGVSARGVDFTDAVLTSADLVDACLESACLVEVDLRDAVLQGASFARAEYADALFMDQSLQSMDFSGANLTDAVFINVDLDRAVFSGAVLSGCSFVHCTGRNAVFRQANLSNLRMVEQCDFSDADFTASNLRESCLRESLLCGCRFDNADLGKADLSGSDVSLASFYRSIAIEARLINTDLSTANLSGANLMAASLERADLRKASLKGSNLFQSDLARVHVDRQTDFDQALTERMRTYPRKFPKEDAAV